MQDARVRIALILICLACLLGSGIVLLTGRHAPPVVITPPPAEAAPQAAPPPPNAPAVGPKPRARIYVDVGGEVRRPSLYALPANSRVMQAIQAAGGPDSDADMEAVNLAQKVTDGEKVFVPKRSPAPFLPLPAAGLSQTQTMAKAGKAAKSSHSNKVPPESGEQIGLNTATVEDLQRLPSIGPAMAERILAYRQQAGGFQKVEDLMQVTGIGPKKFAKIAPFVKLD